MFLELMCRHHSQSSQCRFCDAVPLPCESIARIMRSKLWFPRYLGPNARPTESMLWMYSLRLLPSQLDAQLTCCACCSQAWARQEQRRNRLLAPLDELSHSWAGPDFHSKCLCLLPLLLLVHGQLHSMSTCCQLISKEGPLFWALVLILVGSVLWATIGCTNMRI